MDAEAKIKQVEQAASATPDGAAPVNDLQMLHPEPSKFVLGSRTYDILPLKLKDMRLLVRLSAIKKIGETAEQLDEIVGMISRLLGEPDKSFLEENLDLESIAQLFNLVQFQNYGPLPKSAKDKQGN